MGKLFKGIAAGTIMGAAIGIAVLPTLDRKTQRKIKRFCKKTCCMLEDCCDDVKEKLK
ncbi:YtxH domain-containing protein [uncultured Clostridium sp.]|jgi:gas vesicle protein|uniref:YtxH domain-containing protein n=1 Tax=uncultured Clostridium sp. TaxID=59620 RepID=UPI002633DF94|nr:YtxH domain-containing protein [uncultured Clostridium sp.]